jgi:hypothetical protein
MAVSKLSIMQNYSLGAKLWRCLMCGVACSAVAEVVQSATRIIINKLNSYWYRPFSSFDWQVTKMDSSHTAFVHASCVFFRFRAHRLLRGWKNSKRGWSITFRWQLWINAFCRLLIVVFIKWHTCMYTCNLQRIWWTHMLTFLSGGHIYAHFFITLTREQFCSKRE